MIKKVILILSIVLLYVLLISVVVLVINSKRMKQETLQKVSSQTVVKNTVDTSGEWPQLYSGITWNKPNVGFVNAYLVDPQKDVIVNQIRPEKSDITQFGQKAEKFSYTIAPAISSSELNNTVSYYENWFKSHGWNEDIFASGPTGEEYGFIMNGERFLLSVHYVKSDLSEYAVIVEHNWPF